MNLVSVFDIFKIGIGPSSSHTVGPMLAARHFSSTVIAAHLREIVSLKVNLFGSLSLTGKGHGTDRAIICGLEGESPDSIDTDIFTSALERIDKNHKILLADAYELQTDSKNLISFNSNSLPLHPNGMIFELILKDRTVSKAYYSVGGGFISDENGQALNFSKSFPSILPHNFSNAEELLNLCSKNSQSVSDLVFENEKSIRTEEEILKGLNVIWSVMNDSIERGCNNSGILPGGLGVTRRASAMLKKLNSSDRRNALTELDYLSCYALAVNEENASFGRVVTAPTNGAAGIIPAVFKFYICKLDGDPTKIGQYLFTAAAIANLFKSGASLSAAEMGCQGEIGVAASMAAASLTALQGGSPAQVENAAEIAIEHSLGLTCDPIGGLVQIPCIERNAIGAAKAVASSQLALQSDGTHIVSLDEAIAAMKKTGQDMHSKYKETSTGGLAVTVAAPEC